MQNKKKANNGKTKNHVTKDNNKRYNRTFLSIITQKRSNFQKPLKSFKFILKLCFLYMERYLEKQRVSIHILMDAWSPSTVSKAITYICRVKRGYSFMTIRKRKKKGLETKLEEKTRWYEILSFLNLSQIKPFNAASALLKICVWTKYLRIYRIMTQRQNCDRC